ncbi:hypothetical protein MTDSW087_04970 [Methylobacterium dankookense]|jgi:hypothetical protein|uniref:Anti-sigma factor NepR domain-containing protein n=1 Tax=Methylobacterium dankookense TaxID=560405 RepID=A0A564G5C3_9HYPH|nr:hypothetical protein IFDJLNFL_5042 [Methylobacterium dankookense]VUF15234.1 hypothetical protein MTDSW087_04970 [Methylobacterium dankookense]
MRQCHQRHPSRSSATQDPCLHGVGHGLEEAYDDLLRETLPEDWKRLADLLAERVEVVETRKES